MGAIVLGLGPGLPATDAGLGLAMGVIVLGIGPGLAVKIQFVNWMR